MIAHSYEFARDTFKYKKTRFSIFKTFLGKSKMDILKCPNSTFQNTFDFFKIEKYEKMELEHIPFFFVFL